MYPRTKVELNSKIFILISMFDYLQTQVGSHTDEILLLNTHLICFHLC